MQHHDDRRSLRPVVGIDVAKQRLDGFVDLPAARSFSFANDDAGRAALLAELRRVDVALVCIEATGRYHRCLAADLLDAGIPVAVVNPQRVREFARATGRLEKTDPIDARVLAEFARAVGPRCAEKAAQKQTELRDLVSRRRALVQVRVAETNRLADDAPKLARTQAAKLLRFVGQQIEDLEPRHRQARRTRRRLEPSRRPDRRRQGHRPGHGPPTRRRPARTGQTRPPADRQARRGRAPLNCDSGQRRGQRHIRGGRHDVRLTLYMGAFNAILHNPRFAAFAQRLKDAGKPFKVIVTAAMRKLLVILNQMVKTNTPWNPDLAFKFD